MDIQAFATRQLGLLSSELAAETSANTELLFGNSPTVLKRVGLAVLNLSISSQRTGLGGKTVLELEEDTAVHAAGGVLEHDLRTGDIVRVGEQPKGSERKKEKNAITASGITGVVVKSSQRGLHVALDKEDDNLDGLSGRLWVVKLANDVTYKRMNQVMEKMQKLEEKDQSTLARILFGLESPSPVPSDQEAIERDIGPDDFIDQALNDSQRDAVRFALCSREVALIHGPPGTGKTYTLIELILQLIRRNQRVLVCGPSNLSVDNIVERLAPHKLPIIRLGHPARLLPSVLNHSLDVLIRTSDAAAIVKDIRDELDAKQASIRKTKSGRERKAIYTDMKDLRKDYRVREGKCVDELVRSSKVVLSTLHGAGGYQLRHTKFDVLIIDEASQALEAQCWIPLLNAKKVILAGDHLQLPPTIKSIQQGSTQPPQGSSSSKTDPSKITLSTTLFSRILSLHGPSISRMLTTQYRMHSTIMAFPSQEMYSSRLIAHPSVASRLLIDLPTKDGDPPVEDNEETRYPLIFYDTQGGDFPESISEEPSSSSTASKDHHNQQIKKSTLLSDSKSNSSEALLCLSHTRSLLNSHIPPTSIALLTPYTAQVSLLSSLLLPHSPSSPFFGVEIGSIDSFQGREKDAVILSLVRSNEKGEVGFLQEERRLNVAMTRARRQVVVVGDGECLSRGSGFLKRWVGWLEAEAEVRYPDIGELDNRG